jgi:hypothetical protein
MKRCHLRCACVEGHEGPHSFISEVLAEPMWRDHEDKRRSALAAVVAAARDLVDNHFDPVFGTLDTISLKPTDDVNQRVGELWSALRALDGT